MPVYYSRHTCTARKHVASCASRVIRSLFEVLTLVFGIGVSTASADPSDICDQTAAIVSRETGVPLDVLLAITLTETGRAQGGETRPWPWTVNMEGKGVWFETEDDARAYVYEHFKRGARSFDVGCFQLNYKWHHQGFSSLDEMFDPLAGGRYVAGFLTDLYAEKGDWEQAAGAYHSRTPEHAERYMALFRRHRSSLGDTPIELAAATTSNLILSPETSENQGAPTRSRINTFPLLQSGGAAPSNGSLVPLGHSTTTRLIDFNGAG